MQRRARAARAIALMLGVAALASAGCSEPPAEGGADVAARPTVPAVTARPTSAVLIVVDTLRADRIVVDGPERPTSARLRAWAGRGAGGSRARW